MGVKRTYILHLSEGRTEGRREWILDKSEDKRQKTKEQRQKSKDVPIINLIMLTYFKTWNAEYYGILPRN